MSRNFCQACSFTKFGVKTRKYIPHTCGKENIKIKPIKYQYMPTRKELDMYLKRLKELMEEH
jgi:hypothetical protein